MHPKPGIFLLLTVLALSAHATVTVTPEEMAEQAQWVQQNLLTTSKVPPFSFTYNGVASSLPNLFSSWVRLYATSNQLDSNRIQYLLQWTNLSDGLQVKCVAIQYLDFPVVEWTVYLTNSGSSATPIIQNLQGLNTTITRTNGPEFVLNGNQGDSASPNSYEPYQLTLDPSSVNGFSSPSGKSCDSFAWPYYNLQTPGGGMILAIGWPGEWASSFTRDSGNDLQIQAGQQTTYLVLNPGEQIRTPLIALMFWQGTNVVRAQNLWRHWYMAHVIPRVNGQPPSTIIAVGGDSTNDVNPYLQMGIKPDILWRDADSKPYTWYPVAPYADVTADWVYTGNWEVDTNSYPDGFGPVSSAVHALGMKFLLWFESERVGNSYSFLATNNPAWLLPLSGTAMTGFGGPILNEGNPIAFNWLTNHIEGMIQANGIDWYREDMNSGAPVEAWRYNDATNRQGITENFYVQGHLAYWDALLAMNPGLRIDCCGSGGRRNDLEAMRRAVPLWRSDFAEGPGADAEQCQTYGLSSWLPFQGTGSGYGVSWDLYSFRSSYVASLITLSPSSPQPKQAYTECRRVAPIMLNGDYYPLTPYSQADDVWMAWQFDRPDTGEGCVQIFRRTNSPVASMTFPLQGLNPSQIYDVQDFDRGDLGWYAGSNLMSAGLTVQLNPQQSAILYYTNAQGVELSAGGSPLAGLKPLAAQFMAAGVTPNGAPLTYSWMFGDGGSSTDQNPSHTYNKAGRYVAQVTASDGQGDTNTAPVTVTVMSGAGHALKTTFAGYSQTGTLTNFPVLFEFGPNLAANGFSYSQMASSNGWDLVFVDSEGTALNYEIEKWNTNGNSYVWVEVPLLASNAYIQAYWGDTNLASTPAPCLTNGSVWENGYVSVWHLGETNGPAYDSTKNRTVGTVFTTYGTCTQGTAGEIGNGCAFDNGYISASATTLPGGSSPRAISAWFKATTPATSGVEIVGYGNNITAGNRFALWMSGTSALGIETCLGGQTFPWAWDANWHHLEAVLPPGTNDAGGVNLYYDGIEKTGTGSGTIETLQDELCFAAIPGYHTGDLSYDFEGVLDEVRISDVARSSNWVWAEYLTIASNAVFNSYGAVTSYVPPVFPITLSIAKSGGGVVIAWPANSSPGALLQESSDLVTWTNSTLSIVPDGANNTVTVQPEGAENFYRLSN